MAAALSSAASGKDAREVRRARAVSRTSRDGASKLEASSSILLVDDDRESLRALRAVLEPLGQRVVTARSGEEALRQLLHTDFAVVLLDMRMPGLDGLETARYIHARPRTRHIPIVFLTAHADDVEQVFRAYEAGAVDYVVKPFHPDVLRGKVSVFVELQRARSEHVREARARAEAEAIASTVGKLQSVSDAALAHLDVRELLREILKRARSVFDADTAALLLRDGEQASLTLLAGEGIEPSVETLDLAREGGMLGAALRGSSLSRGDLVEPERLPGALRECGLRSLIAAPLPGASEPAGVLCLGSRSARRFSDEDLVVLGLSADRAAIAIEHARSYEREHGLVETLQHHLLPDRLPQFPGLVMAARYRAGEHAAQVGGDWYDAINLPDGSLGLVIGDVVGHGIGAATMMGELRAALRAYAVTESRSPARALARLNSLVAGTHGAMVATLLYMVIDADGSRVAFASAGHPPPLLMTSDGSIRFLEHRFAAPLGARAYPDFKDFESELEPGSTVLLYTDGLVERRRETIDVGLERLSKVLREGPADLEQLCSNILARVQQGAGIQDDIALLAVRRLERPGGSLDLELPAEPASVPLSRHRLERWLSSTDASPDDVFAITLAANEACSNAIEHAYGPERGFTFRLLARRSSDVIMIKVLDSGRWRTPRGSDRGRGLRIIEQLMDAVEVQRTATGTTVQMRKALAGNDRS
jgi:serine phosphatase RsbU (regulator of sigma subunit)/DNA-binding response OmpR family regulator/anti-sigma regulatory factor (Ser/Thr protein kinase)